MTRRAPSALREQHLAERVVDLVRAGVREVFALEPHRRRPSAATSPRACGERRGPAGPGLQLRVELREELRVAQVLGSRCLEPLERRDERLRHVAAAERTVAAALVREPARRATSSSSDPFRGSGCAFIARWPRACVRAAWTKRRISSMPLMPGAISTPRETSTPNGVTITYEGADVAGIEPAREHEPRAARQAANPVLVPAGRRHPSGGRSSSRRSGRSSGAFARVLATGSTWSVRGSFRASSSPTSDLQHVGAQHPQDLVHFRLRRPAHDGAAGNAPAYRGREPECALGRHAARRLREHEADGVDADAFGRAHGLGGRDAADLDPGAIHACRPASIISRTSARGSARSISAVPTRRDAIARARDLARVLGRGEAALGDAGHRSRQVAGRARAGAPAAPAASRGRGC